MPHPNSLIAITALCLTAATAMAENPVPRFDSTHPGGNGIIDTKRMAAENMVTVTQDLTGTKGWWFYWNFRVENAPKTPLTYAFQNGNVIGTRGPAASFDNGVTWTWLGTDCISTAGKKVQFTYAFTEDQTHATFAFAPAYVESDLQRFLTQVNGHPHLRVETLCQSEAERSVERLHLGNLSGSPKHRVFLTARHHACESMASYVLEGMLQEVLADTKLGAWFRENVEILAVPFVDKDGVENGDQGKNRIPRDHGRDYAGEALYNSTRAIRAFVPEWSEGGLDIAMDLHCPHIRGNYNEFIYQVGQEAPAIWKEQQRFATLLAAVPESALPYSTGNDLPFGQAWNTGKNYTQGMPMARWAAELPGTRLATTIEVPYANVGDVTITTDRARAFGTTVIAAMRVYLESQE